MSVRASRTETGLPSASSTFENRVNTTIPGPLEGIGAEPDDIDDRRQRVRQDAAQGGVGEEVFELAHASGSGSPDRGFVAGGTGLIRGSRLGRPEFSSKGRF
jgi:hypothetical protein